LHPDEANKIERRHLSGGSHADVRRRKIDYTSLAKLLALFEAAKVEGVILAGTNGEGPSLSATEKRDLVKEATLLTPLPIILGIATPSLTEAQWLASQTLKHGGAGILLMAPAYFREASDVGVTSWFREVIRTNCPTLLYNFPQRTGRELTIPLVSAIAEEPNVIGLKDSSGNPANLAAYRKAMPHHKLFVGDETLLIDAAREGWNGSISGAANVLATYLVQIAKTQDRIKLELIMPALQCVRCMPQPAGHKAWLQAKGILSSNSLRLPLVQLGLATELRLHLESLGV
jgi:dihydrodipicolinate synthase/N-acetylneuraminate lyase